MQSHYQIVIIGAGNAGIMVAAQLMKMRSNLNIIIIDSSDKQILPTCMDTGRSRYL